MPNRSRVTITDVARLAGLSPTAVSLVLNDRPGTRLSQDAAARVRAAAAELGYRPNLNARALSTNRTHTIGFVSDHASTQRYANPLIRGALTEARRQGHVLLIAETRGDAAAERDAVAALVDRQVDGLILAVERSRRIDLPDGVGGTPVVLLNAGGGPELVSILPDELAGGRAIAEALTRGADTSSLVVIGRTRRGAPDNLASITVERRVAGVWSAFEAAGVTPVAEVMCRPWDPVTGYAAMQSVLAGGTRPTAVVAFNDRLALGVYRALEDAGLSVPRDVSIVSFDDDEIAVLIRPELTTAALPYDEMGELAVRLMLDPGRRTGEHLVDMPIRVRGSVSAR